MSDVLRLGIIGAGAIAQSYIKAFETCPVAKLSAIADPRTDVAKAVAESAHCRSYGSHLELASAMSATPSSSARHRPVMWTSPSPFWRRGSRFSARSR